MISAKATLCAGHMVYSDRETLIAGANRHRWVIGAALSQSVFSSELDTLHASNLKNAGGAFFCPARFIEITVRNGL
jgi:hypothetical protein